MMKEDIEDYFDFRSSRPDNTPVVYVYVSVQSKKVLEWLLPYGLYVDYTGTYHFCIIGKYN